MSARESLSNEQLLTPIRTIHAEAKSAYGSPRVTAEIRARGFRASKGRVKRLMRDNGIRAQHNRRSRVMTNSRHKLPVTENLLASEVTPTAPNLVFTSDIRYIWTDEGRLYLAILLDSFQPRSRRLVDQATHNMPIF
ncbi:hypothetical protein PTKU46_23860 [Paraburkholderia terrae]